MSKDFLSWKQESGYDTLSRQQYFERRQVSWDSLATRRLCKAIKGEGYLSIVRSVAQKETGRRTPTLSTFNKVFTSFPFYLTARFIPKMHRIRNLDKGFTKTELYSAWCSEKELFDSHKPLAMIFPWSKLHTMVMHEGSFNLNTPGLVIVKILKTELFIIEPLYRFAATIEDDSWRQDYV